jgi:hypothetical protein
MTSLTQMTVECLNGSEAEFCQFLIWNVDRLRRHVGQHPREVRRLHETENRKSGYHSGNSDLATSWTTEEPSFSFCSPSRRPLGLAYGKVKESRNRSRVAQRVQGGLESQISWHSAHEGGEVVTLTNRRPLPQEMFLVLIFTRGWVDPMVMVRSEGICHWKIQWHHRESIPGQSD